eukprot:jgi/Mesvir1/13088/Mv26292-RA.1
MSGDNGCSYPLLWVCGTFLLQVVIPIFFYSILAVMLVTVAMVYRTSLERHIYHDDRGS